MANPFNKITIGLAYWDPEDTTQEDAKRMVEEGVEQIFEIFAGMPCDLDELFSEED